MSKKDVPRAKKHYGSIRYNDKDNAPGVQEMIYILNSASRKLYHENVIKTLALPQCCSNEYRYSISGEVTQVPPDFQEIIKNKINEKVAIVFIDRYSPGGYTYYPLRLGRLLSSRVEGQRLYVSVGLESFVFPKDLAVFNEVFTRTLGSEGVAKLTDGDTENRNDGYYAFIGQDLFSSLDDFYWNQDGWSASTRALMTNARKFIVNEQLDYVFLRVELRDNFDSQLLPVYENGIGYFNFLKRKQYKLVVSYKYPAQYVDPNKSNRFSIQFGHPLKSQGQEPVSLSAFENSIEKTLQTLSYPEETNGKIDFLFPPPLLDPALSINIKQVDEWYFWLLLALLLAILVLANVAIATDLSKIDSIQSLISQPGLTLKVIAGIVQAACLFGIFKLLGKKFM